MGGSGLQAVAGVDSPASHILKLSPFIEVKKMPIPSISNGHTFITREGCSATVISYEHSSRIIIKFNDRHGHIRSVTAQSIRCGTVKNPYHPSRRGVGYVGVGKYKPSINRVHTQAYMDWAKMIERCYSVAYQIKKPTYVGCYVSPEWLNFQNFAAWHENNYIAGFHLDKDLRRLGNKLYSAETCSYVPSIINTLLYDGRPSLKGLKRGASNNMLGFQASMSVEGNYVALGTYKTMDEAHEVYRRARTEYVRSMAEKYREVLHKDVYLNLASWEAD